MVKLMRKYAAIYAEIYVNGIPALEWTDLVRDCNFSKRGCHLPISLPKLPCNYALVPLFKKIAFIIISIKRSIYTANWAAKNGNGIPAEDRANSTFYLNLGLKILIPSFHSYVPKLPHSILLCNKSTLKKKNSRYFYHKGIRPIIFTVLKILKSKFLTWFLGAA